MAKRIITVSRQFGSGGRSIGKEAAARLGIKYYDKELVEQVADETGFHPGFIEENGEFAPGRSTLSYSFSVMGVPGIMNGMSASDFLWCMQRDVILQLAEQEPCVIVGRCADFILKDRDDCLNVFIYADMDFRKDRIVRLYGESEKSPEKRLNEKDKKRRINYKHYTDREWGAPDNYDIILNSGKLGMEKCVDIICDLYK